MKTTDDAGPEPSWYCILVLIVLLACCVIAFVGCAATAEVGDNTIGDVAKIIPEITGDNNTQIITVYATPKWNKTALAMLGVTVVWGFCGLRMKGKAAYRMVEAIHGWDAINGPVAVAVKAYGRRNGKKDLAEVYIGKLVKKVKRLRATESRPKLPFE